MASYELRLYKPRTDNPQKFTLVHRIPFEASSDEAARAMAPTTQIPKWDDSDWAILYGDNGQVLWKIDRDR